MYFIHFLKVIHHLVGRIFLWEVLNVDLAFLGDWRLGLLQNSENVIAADILLRKSIEVFISGLEAAWTVILAGRNCISSFSTNHKLKWNWWCSRVFCLILVIQYILPFWTFWPKTLWVDSECDHPCRWTECLHLNIHQAYLPASHSPHLWEHGHSPFMKY